MANRKGSKDLGKKIQPAEVQRSGNPFPVNSAARKGLIDLLEEVSTSGKGITLPPKGESIRTYAIKTLYQALKAKDGDNVSPVAMRAIELVLGYTDNKPKVSESAEGGITAININIAGIAVAHASLPVSPQS